MQFVGVRALSSAVLQGSRGSHGLTLMLARSYCNLGERLLPDWSQIA